MEQHRRLSYTLCRTVGAPIILSATLIDQVGRILRHSQVDVNFGAWAMLTLCIAPIHLIAYASVFMLLRHRPEYLVVTLGISMLTVLLALYSIIVLKRRSFSGIPIAQRRPVQSAWVAHAIGFVLVPITVMRMVQPKIIEEWFLIYALWMIQVGGTFFTLGAHAGFMYVTASLCFTLALIVPWFPAYIPLVVGFLMSLNMATQRLFLLRLGREASQEANSKC